MQLNSLKKQKKTKLLILSLIMVILLFVCGCGNTQVTKENYDKIHNGMAFNEVIEILGDDYEVSSDAGYGEYTSSCYVWKGFDNAVITIIFINGEVYSKAQTGL